MKMKEDTLGKIIMFADHAHGEQKRKYSGERYIVHPVRVMEMCKDYTQDICVLAAALLHDVLEDTPVTEEEICKFLDTLLTPDQVIKTAELVVALTDVYTKKNYPSLNRRIRKDREVERLSKVSGEAQTIKYADIIDNAISITREDPDFSTRYLQEGKALLDKMTQGNPVLRVRAVHLVDECIQQLEIRHYQKQPQHDSPS